MCDIVLCCFCVQFDMFSLTKGYSHTDFVTFMETRVWEFWERTAHDMRQD